MREPIVDYAHTRPILLNCKVLLAVGVLSREVLRGRFDWTPVIYGTAIEPSLFPCVPCVPWSATQVPGGAWYLSDRGGLASRWGELLYEGTVL